MPPEPLDYESREPKRPQATPLQPLGGRPLPAPLPTEPLVAMPATFDTVLIRTADHGAIQGIEAALHRADIAAFRDDGDGAIHARVTTLHVAAADLERAAKLRDAVVLRREKFRTYPRQNVEGVYVRNAAEGVRRMFDRGT